MLDQNHVFICVAVLQTYSISSLKVNISVLNLERSDRVLKINRIGEQILCQKLSGGGGGGNRWELSNSLVIAMFYNLTD